MRTPDYHDPLTCADLPLNQEKLDDARDEALDHFVHLLKHYFGRVQIQSAVNMGLEGALADALHVHVQCVANVISGAYTEQVLASTRQSTATMFETLAAGALVTHRAVRNGESSGDMAIAFGAIAACEGRPKILELANAERGKLATVTARSQPAVHDSRRSRGLFHRVGPKWIIGMSTLSHAMRDLRGSRAHRRRHQRPPQHLYAMKHAAWFEYRRACHALSFEPLPGSQTMVDPLVKNRARARADCVRAWNDFHARSKEG